MAPLLALLLLLLLKEAPARDITPKPEFVLGKEVPNITLVTHEGKRVTLKEIAGGHPLLLSFIYTKCTSACPMIVNGIREAVSRLSKPHRVLLVDFDERDTVQDLKEFVKRREIYAANWVVALAKGEDLKRLTRAVDFRFFYDEDTDMFAHPNVLVILSPDLKISGYMMGVRYDPGKLSLLVEKARLGEVSINPIKGILLKCFRYDPVTGTYVIDWSFVAMIVGGLIPILGMAYFLFLRGLIAKLRGVA